MHAANILTVKECERDHSMRSPIHWTPHAVISLTITHNQQVHTAIKHSFHFYILCQLHWPGMYTFTHCPCIFTVRTVLNSRTRTGTDSQTCSAPGASHIISSYSKCQYGSIVTKLLIQLNWTAIDPPLIFTNRFPSSILLDL